MNIKQLEALSERKKELNLLRTLRKEMQLRVTQTLEELGKRNGVDDAGDGDTSDSDAGVGGDRT